MSGKLRFAVDTSFVIALLKGTVESPHLLSEIAFPVPVVGELRFGALASRNPERKLAEIEKLIGSATVLPSDGDTAHVYAELRYRLKTAGTPLPENDVWIAAACVQHGLTLVTLDRHFERIDGLEVASA